jgi:D-alanyl-D-alanine carboxypeptidase (penicillin-binding protein 5/6)
MITGAFGVSLTVTACGISHATTTTVVGLAAHQSVGVETAGTDAQLNPTASLPVASTGPTDVGSGTSAPARTGVGTPTTARSAGAASARTPLLFSDPLLIRPGSMVPAPDGSPDLTLDPDQNLPGSFKPTWPDQGQAQIDIGGSTLGSYGPVETAQPIASVTKTMTAYLILRDHPLSLGQQGPEITITAADVSAYQYDVTQDMSVVPVQAGEELTENQALQALMLPSADNIADVLAQWDTGTTTDSAFVTEMNTEAVALGMTHTQYADASGYDPSSISTAPDQITLGQDAMANPYFANLVDQTSADIPVAGTITNYNSLLGTDGIDGIKTGSTSQAGGCLLFNADITIDGRPLTITGAVLGQDAPSGQELGVGLAAAKALVASTESEVSTYTLVSANTTVAALPLSGGSSIPLHTTQNLTVTGWPGERVTLSLAETEAGTVLQATSTNGQLLGSAPLD